MNKVYLVGAVLFVLLASGVGYLVMQRYETSFVAAQQREKLATANELQRQFAESLSPEVFAMTDEVEQKKQLQSFWEKTQAVNIIRMKVWNDDFTIIWASLGDISGQRIPDNHEVEEAYEGEIEYELFTSGSSRSDTLTERQYKELSEIYVPIYSGEKVAGVLEVYRSTTALRDEAYRETLRYAMLLVIGSLVAFGVVMVVLSRMLKKQA